VTIFSTVEPQRVRRFWIAAVIVALMQTIILGYIIDGRAAILSHGAEVLLKTAPVDPRDLLRGDYVTLNYDISRVPASTLTGGLPAADGDNVLSVRLQPQADGYWGIAESSFSPLPEKAGTVVLKSLPLAYLPVAGQDQISVDYGIERYYLPEGSGKDVEAAENSRLSVAVRVSGDGEAQIRSLLIDGKPVYDEPLY